MADRVAKAFCRRRARLGLNEPMRRDFRKMSAMLE